MPRTRFFAEYVELHTGVELPWECTDQKACVYLCCCCSWITYLSNYGLALPSLLNALIDDIGSLITPEPDPTHYMRGG